MSAIVSVVVFQFFAIDIEVGSIRRPYVPLLALRFFVLTHVLLI